MTTIAFLLQTRQVRIYTKSLNSSLPSFYDFNFQIITLSNFEILLIIGEYQLPLNSVDLAGPVEEWKDLAAVDDGSNQYLGDLCLSLRYVPTSGKLTGKMQWEDI